MIDVEQSMEAIRYPIISEQDGKSRKKALRRAQAAGLDVRVCQKATSSTSDYEKVFHR